MRRPGGGYQPEGINPARPPSNPPNQGTSGVPPRPVTAATHNPYHPPPDYVPGRCPVCGRGECPESAHPRADWIVLVIALISIPLALGWAAWWLSAGGLDVILRGLEGLWP